MNDRATDKMRIGRTVLGSIGTGLLAVLMVGVVSFGANAIRPLSAGTDADANPAAEAAAADRGNAPAAKGGDGDQATKQGNEFAFSGGDEHVFRHKKAQPSEAPKAQPGEAPKEQASEPPKEQPAPTQKPKPAPVATQKPAPTEAPKQTTTLSLEGWQKESKVKLAWSKFSGSGFAYFKLVRSTDGTVSWPTGGNDVLVAAIADPYAPYFADQPACGAAYFYRVFAVASSGSGYAVLAASNTIQVNVACPAPPPEPKAMAFNAVVTEAGAVQLTWEQCGGETFKYYKVVRSQVNATPTYPLQAGDELLAAIGDPAQTGFTDGALNPGETWTYRVLSFGYGGLLGATPAVTVTVP